MGIRYDEHGRVIPKGEHFSDHRLCPMPSEA